MIIVDYLQQRVARFAQNKIIWCKNFLINNREIYKINKLIKNSNKEIVVAYDLLCNPPAIGNFTYILMFVKYLVMKKKKIKFYIIKGNYQGDQGKVFIGKKLKNYLFLVKKLKNIIFAKNLFKIEICDWSSFNKQVIRDKSNRYILFEKYVKKRERFSQRFEPLKIHFLQKENAKFINRYLLKSSDFSKYSNTKIKNFIKKKYISLIIRNDPKIALTRNVTKKYFLKIYKSLKKKFNGYNILIVSDNLGCQTIKKYQKTYKLKKIYYCKSYSKNIFSDIYMQLKSSACFSGHKTGGMVTWPFYSKLPFCIVNYISPNLLKKNWEYYKVDKLYPWWNKNQIYKNSNQVEDLILKINEYKIPK